MKRLWLELGKQVLLSFIIFAGLFSILRSIEFFFPGMRGVLLQWSDPAFVVGIPASIVGVGYVLTIRNPQNYLGFYLGIVMSVLLAVQCYLQGNIDLVFLYLVVFIPFLILSVRNWRRATYRQLMGKNEDPDDDTEPQFLTPRAMWMTHLISLIILLIDYILVTIWLQPSGWTENIAIKLSGGIMITSSIFANYWLIYKKTDAWICWVIYSISGIVLNVLLGNLFTTVLFIVFLLVNGSVMLAWIKLTKNKYGL